MNPLEQIAGWPVAEDAAAAAVVGPSGVLATAGDPNRVFWLASVTKPLAALAMLVAVEEGALDLDRALAEVVDERWVEDLPGATVRHLLAHASGLGPELRQRAAAPGTRRIYSNSGYDVLGEIVTAATEMPFADYLREAVFEPLGMSTATLDGSPAKHGHASVNDLVHVLVELLSPTGLLHETNVRAATTVAFPNLAGVLPGYGRQAHNDWGLGFEIRADKRPHWTSTRNSPATYGHFGRSGTMIWLDPQARLGLIALTNRDFDHWAVQAWPALSDSVLDAFA